jgi:hypothetical protein
MRTYDYKIADLTLRSEVDIVALGLRGFRPFLVESSESMPDCTLSLLNDDADVVVLKELYSSFMSETQTSGVLYKTESGYLYSMQSAERLGAPYKFYVNSSSGHIAINIDVNSCDVAMLRFGLWVAFGIVLTLNGAIAIHSSCVEYVGRGVLFLGESGTGKSTHTRLWCENIDGAHLLNDDSPIVRFVDGDIRVYGSPWSGKTPCYRAEDYPIAALCRLSQAPENRIRRLSTIAAIAALLPSTPPQFAYGVELQDAILATLSQIIAKVPIFHLECLPNSAAAELSRKTIFGDAEGVR